LVDTNSISCEVLDTIANLETGVSIFAKIRIRVVWQFGLKEE